MKPARRQFPGRRVLALAAPLLLACAHLAAAQQLEALSFLRLEDPPANWRDPLNDPFAISTVVARPDGLVFVGGRERRQVHVIDARVPTAPRLVCTFAAPDDVEGLALDPRGDRIWIGGDDQNADADGLSFATFPANPFAAACNFPVTSVPGVRSGAFPVVFTPTNGRRHVAIAGRFCDAPPVSFVDAETPPARVVATWTPPNPRMRVEAVDVTRLPDGRTVAAVAANFAGVYLLDVSALPAAPTLLAHFDWTFTPFDEDGDPGTINPCDRNGDGDSLECGEAGRAGDGLRTNACNQVAFVEAAGRTWLATNDATLGGSPRIWSVDEILAVCPGAASCPDDVDCLPAIPNCPPTVAPLTCPPWPVVDILRPVATYQLPGCPLAAWDFDVEGSVLFVAYADEGAHVIDLAVQGLPAVAGPTPVALTAFASFDTLPGNSDTVLENYPCHPLGVADGCESANQDWNPSPCAMPPQAGAAFRVVVNAGLRSATDLHWAGCRLYVSDQGTPDADGLPAPSHVGTPQGLWILGFRAGTWPVDVGESVRVTRSGATRADLDVSFTAAPLVEQRLLAGTLPLLASQFAYDHACVARGAAGPLRLTGGATTPGALYYLVAGACGGVEGTAGTDSLGNPRPPGLGACP